MGWYAIFPPRTTRSTPPLNQRFSLLDTCTHPHPPTHENTQLPEEVRACESHAKRSKTTGHLLVVMPKVCVEECVSKRERGSEGGWMVHVCSDVCKRKKRKRSVFLGCMCVCKGEKRC